MVKPIDITNTVIVPKPQPKYDKLKSFFIGRAPMDSIDDDSSYASQIAAGEGDIFDEMPTQVSAPDPLMDDDSSEFGALFAADDDGGDDFIDLFGGEDDAASDELDALFAEELDISLVFLPPYSPDLKSY